MTTTPMHSTLQETFNALYGARKILLLPSIYPTRQELFGLMLLALTLEHHQKSVACVVADEFKTVFPPALPRPAGETPILEVADEATIAIRLHKRRVEGLRYEETDGALYIYLALSGQALNAEDLELSNGVANDYDAVFVLGAPELDLITGRRALESLLAETTLINLDADPANEGFGDVNVFAENGCLGSLLCLLEYFPALPQTLEPWRQTLAVKPLSPEALRFLGRMLARLKKDRGFYFTSVSQEDFDRSGYSRERFAAEVEQFPFQASFLPAPFCLLWQNAAARRGAADEGAIATEDADAVEGLIVSRDKRVYRRLARSIPGRYTIHGYAPSLAGNDLESARQSILAVIST